MQGLRARPFCRNSGWTFFAPTTWGCPTRPGKLGPLCIHYNMTGSLQNGSRSHGPSTRRQGPTSNTIGNLLMQLSCNQQLLAIILDSGFLALGLTCKSLCECHARQSPSNFDRLRTCDHSFCRHGSSTCPFCRKRKWKNTAIRAPAWWDSDATSLEFQVSIRQRALLGIVEGDYFSTSRSTLGVVAVLHVFCSTALLLYCYQHAATRKNRFYIFLVV